jgi:uncharacterized protein (DUF342 family)
MPSPPEERTIPVTSHAVLSVSPDQMLVRLAWLPQETDLDDLVPLVIAQMDALEIHPDARREVYPLVRPHFGASGPVAVAVALGTPPTPTVHGRVEWGGDFFSTGFAVDPETGRLDYRQRAGNPIVSANQLLAVIHPPVPGVAGMDVYGRPVNPETPRVVTLRAGKNTHDAGGGQFYAECQGRVRHKGGEIMVDDVLDIPGSVGLETGNINHPGTVSIHGDIEEGAEVVAEGDIEVHGIIEGATVRCGGDLLVHGGIVGAQGCHVQAGGDVHARFILHAAVQADGHVEVEREISQADIQARGAVLVPHGRIAGGTVTAGRGIAVGQAGTEASVPTLLVAGEDEELAHELSELQHHIQEHQHALEKIHRVTEAAHRAMDHLGPKQREALVALEANEENLAKTTAEEVAQLHALQHRRHGGVLIGEMLFADTTLGVGGVRMKMTANAHGPILALPAEEGVRLLLVKDFAKSLLRIKEA